MKTETILHDGRGLLMKSRKMLSEPIAYFLFIGMGFWFCFLCFAVETLTKQGNILWTGSYIGRLMAGSLAAGALLGGLFCFFLYRSARAQNRTATAAPESRMACGRVFAGALLLIVLCWFPAYLAYYPAICAYDMPIQTGQIVSGSYNDHHPLAHTLLVKGAMDLGRNLFGSVNTGIGLLSFLQLLFLASAFAGGIAALHKHGVRVWVQILMLLYSAVFPIHMFMSVSITKDTIFTGFFMIVLLALCILLRKGENSLRPGRADFPLFLGAVGIILFRNNGKYAMLVLLAVLALVLLFGRARRRLWGRLFLCLAAAFLLGNLILSALFYGLNAQQGDKREMLSMPIQQLARCMLYHGGVGVLPEDDNTMSDEDKALVGDFLLDEGYKEYDPRISDPVKSHTNTYVVRYRTLEFAKTYLHLLLEYPDDFINAALALNAGYLSPFDVTHSAVNQDSGEKGLGYVQTRWVEEELDVRGIYQDSKWEGLHESLEEWADSNSYLKIPVLKYLFVPGTWLWLCLLTAGYLLVHRRFGMCIPLALFAGYYITLFLGPTVQLRYIYPVMAALPFTVLLCKCEVRKGK